MKTLHSILAFLTLAATASGQDLEVTPIDTKTIAYTPPDSWGYGSVASLQRGNVRGARYWLNFDLRDVRSTVRSAWVDVPLQYGSILGREDWQKDVIVTIRDAGAVEQFYAHNRPPDEVWRDNWDDIGSGDYYGSVDFSPAAIDGWYFYQELLGRPWLIWKSPDESPYSATIPLSSLAVQDINAARGANWSIGVSLPELQLEPLGDGVSEQTLIDLGGQWRVVLYYGDQPPLGDINGTGRVDQADLDHVLLRWGVTSQADLDAVLTTWGQGQRLGVIAAIPEPTTWLLLAACGIMAIWTRRI